MNSKSWASNVFNITVKEAGKPEKTGNINSLINAHSSLVKVITADKVNLAIKVKEVIRETLEDKPRGSLVALGVGMVW
jgi:hypothetical protein